MIVALIRTLIHWRMLVWALVAVAVIGSVYALRVASLDAIPDISDPQVVVYVKWPRSPQLLESEVTAPLAAALVGSPEIQSIRGTSHMGYSFIYVILAGGADRAHVQQLVLDRINAIRPQLPADALITLGPNSSSMGWIYQYALLDRQQLHDLRELRQLINTLQGVFQEAGGRMIEVTNRDYQLRGVIDSADLDQLNALVIGRRPTGETVHLRDVGYLQSNYDQRRSTVDMDGTGEV